MKEIKYLINGGWSVRILNMNPIVRDLDAKVWEPIYIAIDGHIPDALITNIDDVLYIYQKESLTYIRMNGYEIHGNRITIFPKHVGMYQC